MAENLSPHNHETYMTDNPPQSEQLFRLASLPMASAHETNTHRTMMTPRAHSGVQEIHYLGDASEFGGEPVEIRRRMALRIGRRTLESVPLKSWSLKLYDTHWYKRPEEDWKGVRNLYCFAWNKEGTTLARRIGTIVPYIEPNMYGAINNFAMRDDDPVFLHAHQELTDVTSQDCDFLIADMQDYYERKELFLYRRSAPTTGA